MILMGPVSKSSVKDSGLNRNMRKGVWATDVTVTAIHDFPLVVSGCDIVEATYFCFYAEDCIQGRRAPSEFAGCCTGGRGQKIID